MSTKMTIVFPDAIAASLKNVAGEGKQSEYVARAVRNALLEDDLRALAEWEAAHPTDSSFFADSDVIAEETIHGRAAE